MPSFSYFADDSISHFPCFPVSFNILFRSHRSSSFFRSLKCDRLRVHKNFMMALVIRYTVSVMYYEPYIYGSHSESPIWFRHFDYLCKIVLILMMYGYVAPIFWMFIEGVYLHSRVATNVMDSRTPFKFYYCVGWGK